MIDIKVKHGSASELEHCVKLKLEQASLATSNKRLGEALFVRKRLELAPFPAVNFEGWALWERDPLNNRSWQWRLNWLSFISYLMAYHRASGDDAIMDFAAEAIQSWLGTYLNTDIDYPFEFIWHDHATALRAEQLVFFIFYSREYSQSWASKNGEFLTSLEQALKVHAQWLAKDSFYSEHTNHGLEQARVLLLLGTIFDGCEAREWQQIAIRRISSELAYSFTEEGVHVENSPAYHIFVFKVFLSIIKDYPEEVLGDLAERFSQFSAKALSFITHILRPDGMLPPIGDTEQLSTSDAYRDSFNHRLEYQYFLYALTQGKQGVRPQILNRVYSKSGYAIFRDQWPDKEDYLKAFHLIAKVGCLSRYHHQQDEGHISLFAGGEDWLIDSGLYNYINQDPVRKYMRSRAAHNVPLISHASYSKDFEHRLRAWEVIEHSVSNTKSQMRMKFDVLHPVCQERFVSFDALTKIVEVSDKVSASDDQERNITLLWHFPKDKTLAIDTNQVIVTSPKGNRLVIDFLNESPDDISVISGRKEDRVFSCISYKANQVEPSKLLRVVFKDRRQFDTTTRFTFYMAENSLLPTLKQNNMQVYSFPKLLALAKKDELILTSVLIGDVSAYLDLAQAHRNQGIGHVSLLIDEADTRDLIQLNLNKRYLSTWLKCHMLTSRGPSVKFVDKASLGGIENVGRLIITPSGFNEERLTTVLLTVLPLLLKRMAKKGEVWISMDVSASLKNLCCTFAEQQGLKVLYVSEIK